MLSDEAFLSYGWRVAFLVSLALVVLGIAVRLKVDETPAFQQIERRRAASRIPLAQLLRDPGTRRHTLLGMAARWGEGAAFHTWGVSRSPTPPRR
ncbi:hypothetical protein [Streptomyces decoyicus]